jgi:hypothetical protein
MVRQRRLRNVISNAHDPKVEGYPTWIGQGRTNATAVPHVRSLCQRYKSGLFAFYGGHVITGTTAKEMSKGSQVYIYPICNRHNSHNSGYMEVKYNAKGVELKYWET